jgi:hypothetical protein
VGWADGQVAQQGGLIGSCTVDDDRLELAIVTRALLLLFARNERREASCC